MLGAGLWFNAKTIGEPGRPLVEVLASNDEVVEFAAHGALYRHRRTRRIESTGVEANIVAQRRGEHPEARCALDVRSVRQCCARHAAGRSRGPRGLDQRGVQALPARAWIRA